MTLGEFAIQLAKLYFGGKTALGAVEALGKGSEKEHFPTNIASIGGTRGPMRLITHKVGNLDDRMRHIVRLCQAGRLDPKIRKIAASILGRKCGDKWCIPEKDYELEVRALFRWVRKHVRYTRDIEGYDTYQSAVRTLELGVGDCDDFTILVGSILLSSGFPVKARVIKTKDARDWNHIFPMVGLPPGGPTKWMALDASVPKPPGWHAPMEMIDKIRDYPIK